MVHNTTQKYMKYKIQCGFKLSFTFVFEIRIQITYSRFLDETKSTFCIFVFQTFYKKKRPVVSVVLRIKKTKHSGTYMLSLRVHLAPCTQGSSLKKLELAPRVHLSVDRGVTVPYIYSLQNLQFERDCAPA